MGFIVDNAVIHDKYTVRLHGIVKERIYGIIEERVDSMDETLEFVTRMGSVIGVEVMNAN